MKSHVSLEQHQCPVCGTTFDTNTVLIHKQLTPVLEHHTVTGRSLCPVHQQLSDDGYLALVECDDTKSTVTAGHAKQEQVWRTGNIAHVRRSVAAQIFTREVTAKDTMWFIDTEAFAMMQQLAAEAR